MSNLAVIMRACEQFKRSESYKRCIMDVRAKGKVNVASECGDKSAGASNKGNVGHVSDT